MDFKAYIASLAASAALVTLLTELSPSRFRSAVSVCLGMYLLFVTASPLLVLIDGGFFGEDFIPEYSTEQGEGGYSDTVGAATAEGVGRAVAEHFGLDAELIEVTLVGFDAYELTAERVYLKLTGRAAYIDFHAAERFVEEIIGGKNGQRTKCTAEIALG